VSGGFEALVERYEFKWLISVRNDAAGKLLRVLGAKGVEPENALSDLLQSRSRENFAPGAA
jgi:hypothetical protein